MKHLNSWWWETSTSALPYLVIKGHKVWSVSPEYFIFSTFFSDPVRSLSCLDCCTVLQTKLTFAQDLYQLLYNKVLDDGFNSVQWCNKKSDGSQEVLAISKLSQINHYMRSFQEMSTYFRRKLTVLFCLQNVREVRFFWCTNLGFLTFKFWRIRTPNRLHQINFWASHEKVAV